MISVLDLFCGAGGSSAGARAAGANVIGGVDMSALATATFKDNFPAARIETRMLDAGSRPSRYYSRGDIDLILASPECTNHSPAKGAVERCEISKGTSSYVASFARYLRPRWIVLENVVQLRNWKGYAALTEELEELGYRLRPQILNAADFGVPQTRRRLFIMAELMEDPPEIRATVKRHRPATQVVKLKGPWLSNPLKNGRRAEPTLERAERAIEALGPQEPFLIVYYGSDGAGGWQALDRPIRTLTTLDRFGLVTWDRKVPMLRMLQVPELQAAMGLPPEFLLDRGSRRDKVRLIGNGVAPPVIQAIIEQMCVDRVSPRKPATISMRSRAA